MISGVLCLRWAQVRSPLTSANSTRPPGCVSLCLALWPAAPGTPGRRRWGLSSANHSRDSSPPGRKFQQVRCSIVPPSSDLLEPSLGVDVRMKQEVFCCFKSNPSVNPGHSWKLFPQTSWRHWVACVPSNMWNNYLSLPDAQLTCSYYTWM